MYGLTVEEASGPPCEVWPDNWPSVELFTSVSTQWRMGPAGPVGLDYAIAFRLMDRLGLSERAWDWMFDDLRVLEDAALEQMRKEAR